MQKFILSLVALFCTVGIIGADTPENQQPPMPNPIPITKNPIFTPRSLTEVVAYAHVGANSVEVSFVAPMGEVTLYLTGESGVVDMVVVNSATENATLLLDDITSGNYTITLVDALGNEYSGAFSR